MELQPAREDYEKLFNEVKALREENKRLLNVIQTITSKIKLSLKLLLYLTFDLLEDRCIDTNVTIYNCPSYNTFLLSHFDVVFYLLLSAWNLFVK